MREGADLARGAARRRLAGERERAVSWLGNLAGQQVQVIDEIVAPDAACVLVEAHGPEAGDLDLGIGIELRQLLQPGYRNTRQLRRLLERVVRHELRILVEGHVAPRVGLRAVGGAL